MLATLGDEKNDPHTIFHTMNDLFRKSEKPSGLNFDQLKEQYLEAEKRCSKRLHDDIKRIEK